MSEWPNRWMLRLLETTDWGVDTACCCNCHFLCLWFLSVARILSGFVMVAQAAGLKMGVGRISRPWRGVWLLAMPEARLDTTRPIESVCEVPPGAGVLWLLVPSMAGVVIIDRRCVAKGVEVTHWVISGTPELFREVEGVEFWPGIVEATELPPWEESLSPDSAETHLLAEGRWEFPESLRFCCFWIIRTTGVVSGWGLWECTVQYRCSTLRM